MRDSHLIETRLSGQALFKGHFLHAFRDVVALPDGQSTVREYIVHPGAVMVIHCLKIPKRKFASFWSGSFAILLDR